MPFLQQQKNSHDKVKIVPRFRSQNTNVVQKHKNEKSKNIQKSFSFSHT